MALGRRKLRFERIASTAAVRTHGNLGIIPNPYDVDGDWKTIVSIRVKISEQNMEYRCRECELDVASKKRVSHLGAKLSCFMIEIVVLSSQ